MWQVLHGACSTRTSQLHGVRSCVWARTGSRFSPLLVAGDLGRAVSSRGLNVHSADSFASASAAMASLFWRARSLRVSSPRGSGCTGHQHAVQLWVERCSCEWLVEATSVQEQRSPKAT